VIEQDAAAGEEEEEESTAVDGVGRVAIVAVVR